MALCLVIVAGSVLFGVFGPGIAQRSMLSGGISIGDLVGSAVTLRDQLVWQAREQHARMPEEERTRQSRAGAATALARVVGPDATIPDLTSAGFELSAWSVVSLRGERDDTLALAYIDEARESFVALFLTADDGHFVVYDRFGRAVPLLPDRLFAEDVPGPKHNDGVAMIWSTGPVLAIAVIDSTELADSLRAVLGAP